MGALPAGSFPGRYHAAASPLHGIDPRSKLILLPLLIVAVFAAREGTSLLLLFVFWVSLWRLARLPWRTCLRLVWMLRVLLLFTLLVYLLMTPGYTLLGIPWLSRDGLQLGLQVCLQLLLALGFSLLLSMTTSPAGLASAIEAALRPIKRFGVPVSQVAVSLRLVLHFNDFLLVQLQDSSRQTLAAGSLKLRASNMLAAAAGLLEKAFVRADACVLAMSKGEPLPGMTGEYEPLSGFGVRDVYFLSAGSLVLVVLLVTY